MRRVCRSLLPALLALFLFSGCAAGAGVPARENLSLDLPPLEEVDLPAELVALADTPAVDGTLKCEHPGKLVQKNSLACIDYSNTADGYVMACYTASTDKRLKAVVSGPTTKYQYNLTAGEWAAFPLSDGDGEYKVTVYENVKGTSYANVCSVSFQVRLTDEFAPFLRPNQYVDFASAPDTVAKAKELTKDLTDPLDKVKAVYDYVIKHVSYDKELAANVKSGYLPVLDDVLEAKKGICFDYAALMTGMLRSQKVPCKLVVGYAGTQYHAWISVWSEETGWIDGVVYFDGSTWQRMDPTFASNANESEAIMKYIGDGSNYTVKYLY